MPQRTKFLRRAFACALALSVVRAQSLAQNVWRVNANASAGGDGLTWPTAFRTLDEALAQAWATPDLDEIRVSRGTYRPSTLSNPADPRSATFSVPSGTTIQGGWNAVFDLPPHVGVSTTTILSGGLGPAGRAYHVVTVPMFVDPVDPGVALKNLTVRDGNANNAATGDDSGGGILLVGATPSIVLDTCTLSHNSASNSGAGLYMPGITAWIKWCRFVENHAGGQGGALYAHSSLLLYNSVFVRNSADEGGALAGDKPSVATLPSTVHQRIVGCRFKQNVAFGRGGALCFDGAANLGKANYSVVNCTLSENAAGIASGGIHAEPGQFRWVRNSILWADVAPLDPELPPGLQVDYCDVYDANGANYPGSLGLTNFNLDPLLTPTQALPSLASPAVDAGRLMYGAFDFLDLDGDGDTTEKLPLDIRRNPRVVYSDLDVGAYELQ